MASFQNPETVLIKARQSISVNQKALNAELKSMYIRKAYRVGMSLEAYCQRFGINKVWEKQHEID